MEKVVPSSEWGLLMVVFMLFSIIAAMNPIPHQEAVQIRAPDLTVESISQAKFDKQVGYDTGDPTEAVAIIGGGTKVIPVPFLKRPKSIHIEVVTISDKSSFLRPKGDGAKTKEVSGILYAPIVSGGK